MSGRRNIARGRRGARVIPHISVARLRGSLREPRNVDLPFANATPDTVVTKIMPLTIAPVLASGNRIRSVRRDSKVIYLSAVISARARAAK